MRLIIFGMVILTIIVFFISIDIGLSITNNITSPEIDLIPTPHHSIIEMQIHQLINEQRKLHNLEPLQIDSQLSDIAREHSKDMAIRGYFDHVTPEGLEFWDRYNENGYDCNVMISPTEFSNGGENLVIIYHKDSISKDAVDAWLNSPQHKANMLTDYYTKHGVGVYIDDGVYITNNFC